MNRSHHAHGLMGEGINIRGIDFTSAPSRRKPISCAKAAFDGRLLSFERLIRWKDFREFEQALRETGPWIAAIDFPFGQSRRLIENLWTAIGRPLPKTWSDYVSHFADMGKQQFRRVLTDYRSLRPKGDKHHKRKCDELAKSQSPQTLDFTPVGLMFFEGAPRLLSAGVHVPHLRKGDARRTVLEGYPGVLARSIIGKRSYKNDTKPTEDHHAARREMLTKLINGDCQRHFGFRLQIQEQESIKLVEDPGGDDLDALLCAVQAAWGWKQRKNNYGAPKCVDRLEGWICDPGVVEV